MKKKYYLLVIILVIVIAFSIAIKNKYTQSLSITYPCVTVDIESSKIVDEAAMKIIGKVSGISNKKFSGDINIGSLPITIAGDVKMSDILISKNEYGNNFFGSLIYNSYSIESAAIKMDYIGTLYLKNAKMDKIVIALDNGSYVIAPAKNMQEALAIYNNIMK